MTPRCEVCGGTDLVWTTRLGTATRVLCARHRRAFVARWIESIIDRKGGFGRFIRTR